MFNKKINNVLFYTVILKLLYTLNPFNDIGTQYLDEHPQLLYKALVPLQTQGNCVTLALLSYFRIACYHGIIADRRELMNINYDLTSNETKKYNSFYLFLKQILINNILNITDSKSLNSFSPEAISYVLSFNEQIRISDEIKDTIENTAIVSLIENNTLLIKSINTKLATFIENYTKIVHRQPNIYPLIQDIHKFIEIKPNSIKSDNDADINAIKKKYKF